MNTIIYIYIYNVCVCLCACVCVCLCVRAFVRSCALCMTVYNIKR